MNKDITWIKTGLVYFRIKVKLSLIYSQMQLIEEVTDDDIQIFKINFLLILKNILWISIFLAIFSIFSKNYINEIYVAIFIIVGCFLSVVLSDSVTMIEVDTKFDKTTFQIRTFLFYKRIFKFNSKEFSYSYKDETGARGIKLKRFTIYNMDNEKIIKINPFSSGWSEGKILSIIELFKQMSVNEIGNRWDW